jgi:hypothetical protein
MKKSLFIIIFAVITAIPCLSQDYEHLYQRKVQTYKRMENAGWTMTGVGGGCGLLGGILIATLPDGYWNYDYYDDYDPDYDVQAAAGFTLICLGVGLMAGGITMGSIGSRKVKSYQRKLDNLSIGLMSTPKAQGLTLTYRF